MPPRSVVPERILERLRQGRATMSELMPLTHGKSRRAVFNQIYRLRERGYGIVVEHSGSHRVDNEYRLTYEAASLAPVQTSD